MATIEEYMQCMQKGDYIGLANLFNEQGILHNSALTKIGRDPIHLKGKKSIEMMYYYLFGFNGGPFKTHCIHYKDSNTVSYFITRYGQIISVNAYIAKYDDEGKISLMIVYSS